MGIIDSIVKFAGGDLTPGFNLPGPSNIRISPGIQGGSAGGGVTSNYGSGPGFQPDVKAPAPPTPIQYSGQVQGAQTTAAPQADPYAQWGGQGAYNNLMGSFNTQRGNISSSAMDAANNYGIGLGGNITDYVNSLKSGQNTLDERGVQNELALKQGRAGILDMISRGIRSGGVTLANRNAGDSSAAGALANAYGDIGRRQLSNVGNQYSLENRNIGLAQQDFNTQAQAGQRRITDSESQAVNGIVSNAQNQLSQLDAWAADKSLPERIQVEQEKANIQAQVQQALAQYGPQLQQGVAGVTPTSVEQNRTTALGLSQAGTAATSPFDFTSQVPAQLQNTGPFGGNLPLFTAPRKKIA